MIVESEDHPWKQYSPIRSTVEGMQIDDNDEQKENAKFPKSESAESDSKMILETCQG
jgi:hypothetical protein